MLTTSRPINRSFYEKDKWLGPELTLLCHPSNGKGTWNIRSLYRSGSLTTVARELARYKLTLVGAQEVRWDKGTIQEQGVFFSTEEERKSSIGKSFFLHHRILSAVNRVAFVSDRVSYIVLRGRWSNIIFMNVSAPSEEKSDDLKTVFRRN